MISSVKLKGAPAKTPKHTNEARLKYVFARQNSMVDRLA